MRLSMGMMRCAFRRKVGTDDEGKMQPETPTRPSVLRMFRACACTFDGISPVPTAPLTTDLPTLDSTEMMDRRKEVVAGIKELKAECKPLLTMLEDPALAKGDRKDKGFKDTLVMMAEKNGITAEMVESLYKYGKLLFECGNYGQVEAGAPMGAAEFLAVYRMLAKDSSSYNCLSAMWGKLAAEILLEKWGDAIDTFKKLREVIDTRHFENPLHQLEQRTWLIHWALFVYLKPELAAYPNGRNEMIDLFFSERYLQTIQTNCPHMLRYLAVAVITAPLQRRNVIRELVKLIQQERETYSDPITGFIECLLVLFDFDSAQEKLKQCAKLRQSPYPQTPNLSPPVNLNSFLPIIPGLVTSRTPPPVPTPNP